MEQKRLYKSNRDKIFCGVCGGIGEYCGIDPKIVRLIVVLLALTGSGGLLLYIAAALIIPKHPAARGAQVYYQQSRPGVYSAGGATTVNRASSFSEEEVPCRTVFTDPR